MSGRTPQDKIIPDLKDLEDLELKVIFWFTTVHANNSAVIDSMPTYERRMAKGEFIKRDLQVQDTIHYNFESIVSIQLSRGLVLMHVGLIPEAEECFQTLKTIGEVALAPSHVLLLQLRYCQAKTRVIQSKTVEAVNALGILINDIAALDASNSAQAGLSTEATFLLGVALLDQMDFSEAEHHLKQASECYSLLGLDQNVLETEEILSSCLQQQKRFTEASDRWNRLVRYYESRYIADKRGFGEDHMQTLQTMESLGRTLFSQGNNLERASFVQQQIVHAYKTKFVGKQWGLLCSELLLAQTLCYQTSKHGQAVDILWKTTDGLENLLGRWNPYTVTSKFWLGKALYKTKTPGCLGILRRTVNDFEKISSSRSHNYLESKLWLGKELYAQRSQEEVKQVFKEVADGFARLNGRHSRKTLESRLWFGLSLGHLGARAHEMKDMAHDLELVFRGTRVEYFEATELLQELNRQGKLNLIAMQHRLNQPNYNSVTPFRKTHQASETSPPGMHFKEETSIQRLYTDVDTNGKSRTSRLGMYFEEGASIQRPYTDVEIDEMSILLKELDPTWSRLPRTYILLRLSGHLNLISDLVELGFSDHWYPVTENSLPGSLSPSAKTAIVRLQHLILTKGINLEKGEKGNHCNFDKNESFPFKLRKPLGSGGFGKVDKVQSPISQKYYARKRVPRTAYYNGSDQKRTKSFIDEIELLKSIKHRHIVELVGSYTDTKYIGLIMSPVADMDLAAYLRLDTPPESSKLRPFFGCLAKAIEFLHQRDIRHRDIKPGNILIYHETVLLTDFGLARDFSEEDGSTSVGIPNALSYRYCAPEVARSEFRNKKSDMWSLGVVFMEMMAVLKGKSVDHLDELIEKHGSQRPPYIRTNLDALGKITASLESIGNPADNLVINYTRELLSAEGKDRPTASNLSSTLANPMLAREIFAYCGQCCISPAATVQATDEDFLSDVYEDDLTD
ncbi:hypothetical protein BU24DRAFT_424675 [Aaosphaeria arxii CBS 175.79]|uniref:Protein kinase domain-containing protein n=1 Tax=Aaosphaeria arxii CBS 175.79 TaxID=1450172 RepID=A0A6A5XMV5_9PLEO|nr:uncharacterized protein BU24DRAFT_424675 [Aaosphaeria arxii CBS 175.79]KAF2013674.1 hypothetical protein BU24DRAFT_424675 [Aaosphaeria arxii CBS 175.79]